MKVRIKKSFAGYRVGQEFDWGDGMARIYLGRGMVEEVACSAAEPATPKHDTSEPKVTAPRIKKATQK